MNAANPVNPTLDHLFEGGPPLKIEQLLHLVRQGDPQISRRAWIVVLIGWVPLLVLAAIQELLRHNGALPGFLMDFAAYGRSLVAAPLFILAEAWCLPALGRITRHFVEFGIVRDEDKERFDHHVQSTRSELNSTFAEVLALILAYGVAIGLRLSIHLPLLPPWTLQPEGRTIGLSPAGLWQMWVSLPLLLILFFGWIWRQFLWCRLLWKISRLDLKLIAAHPDRVGGLRFLGAALWGDCPLAFALAAPVAGSIANQIRLAGASLYDYRYFVVGVVFFVLAFFVSPFLLFTTTLRRLRSRGTLEYGGLSGDVGKAFEAKWLKRHSENGGPEALEAPDFSATTDLYSITANVYEIRYLPLSSRSLGELVAFTLIPFVPVLLASVPVDTVLNGLKEILL